MSATRELTRFGETARQLRAVVPRHERIRDPDRQDNEFSRLLRRFLGSLPSMAFGALTVIGGLHVADQTLVPRADAALVGLVRETLAPLNPPGKEIDETEIKGLAETIRQLTLILKPGEARPWLKDLARMIEFNGDPDLLNKDRGRLLRFFLAEMEKFPAQDRPARMADILLNIQSRQDWMPFARMLSRFSTDFMDLSRADRIPALEQAMRAALEKARAEGDLRKAKEALEMETRELDNRRQTEANNSEAIRRYIQSAIAADKNLRACADAFVTCQRRLEKKN